MSNSDFLNRLFLWLRQQGCEEWRIAGPSSASPCDMVLHGHALSATLAKALQQQPCIAQAEYVSKARALNIRFHDDALFGTLAAWRNEPRPACCCLTPDRADNSWDNPFYVVQYAHHRAGNVAHDRLHWDYDLLAARQLAMAIVQFPQHFETCDEPWPFMQKLVDFSHVYTRWHETLLAQRAQKIRDRAKPQTNGDLMQKEAIQHPITSALLARAAAITLQNGLRMLTIEPTKDWVE
jgi:hypothetical protein